MHRAPRTLPLRATALCLLLAGAAGAHAQEAEHARLEHVRFFTTELTQGLGLPFSEAVRVGDLLFLSGMIGLRPGTMELVPGGIGPETRQTMENIRTMLAAAGAEPDDVVKCTVMLDEMADWPAFNALYVEFFGEHRPVRSALGADGLALGAAVEVECIAALPAGRRASVRSPAGRGEDEERAVLAAAQALLDVINTRDGDAARDLLLAEGALVRVIPTPEGGRPEAVPHDAFIRSIAAAGPAFLERMWDPEVRIHGPIATVWTPYDFYVDGAFSHCGINAFTLVQSGEEWKVAGVIYTVEREGCPVGPLGEPGS
jgi:2-iminobutanoate/2-iminopropanoate deaminase